MHDAWHTPKNMATSSPARIMSVWPTANIFKKKKKERLKAQTSKKRTASNVNEPDNQHAKSDML
jgi:hypothetical protein